MRNSTACLRSGTLASRRFSTSPHTYSACACRSSTVTRRGRGPSPRVANRCLRYWRGASAISGIGNVEHLLGRAVVLRQRDDLRPRREAVGKAEDVFHRGGAEGIDRLRIIADHREPGAIGLQRMQDLRLQLVGVLIFIDQHVIEMAAHVGGEPRIGHHDLPVEQQVVVIEKAVLLLALDVCAIEPRQVRFPLRAPGKLRSSVSLSGRCVLTRWE